MKVTAVVPLSKTRYRIEIDGETAFVLYGGELRRYGVAEGRELARTDWEEIMHQVLPRRAKLRCMKLLTARNYTRAQLIDRLRQGEYPPETVEEAVAYVESFGYVDDEAYARSYVEDHIASRSRRRITEDLRRKGVSAGHIEAALLAVEERDGMQDEESMIRRLLEKKHFDPQNADRKERQRIQAFLYRKGFSPEKIRKALNAGAWEEDTF